MQSESPPEIQLLSAVLAMAVRDSYIEPNKSQKGVSLNSVAASALDFLFTDMSDGYLQWIDIDPGHFRSKLLEQMNDTSYTDVPFKAFHRRCFRINYKLWKAEYDRLGGRVSGDEETDPDDARFDAEEPEGGGERYVRPNKRGRKANRTQTVD